MLSLVIFFSHKAYGEDVGLILQQLQTLQKDIKTLEKAVYSQGVNTTSSSSGLSNNNNDILIKQLLKLSEL